MGYRDYRARNKREAKKLALRIAAQELDVARGAWEIDMHFDSDEEHDRFDEAWRELIGELERRSKIRSPSEP